MLEIRNTRVYDLRESIISCRNAMRLDMPEYTDEEFQKGLDRAKKLVQASKNGVVKCHDNFLTGIRVSFDLKYTQPLYAPELQRSQICPQEPVWFRGAAPFVHQP